MRTFVRDEDTNDLTFGYYASKVSNTVVRDFNLSSGAEGVLAVVESIVKTQKGELALDTTAGIDHVGLLANGENMLAFWKDEMEDAVSGCSYVTAIKSFNVESDSGAGKIEYSLELETTEGEVETSGDSASLASVSHYSTKVS